MVLGYGLWIEDEEEFSVEKKLDQSLSLDDVASFLEVIESDFSRYRLRGQEFLMKACIYHAFHCATLLLNGETPLILDVNRPTPLGMFPIHYAICSAGMIELLLWHGARTDLRCRIDVMPKDPLPHLPLDLPLFDASSKVKYCGWVPGDCIFRMVTLICSCCFDLLERIEVLAWNTEGLPDEFLRYAREGNILHVALLLAVARARLNSPISSIRESVSSHSSSLAIPEDKKEDITLLLDVFEKAGDALHAYMRTFESVVTIRNTSRDVAVILSDAGFPTQPGEYPRHLCGQTFKLAVTDVGMEHFGKSGHRWMTWNPASNECCSNASSESKMASGGERKESATKYVVTEEDKLLMMTAVDKVVPIPIPPFSGWDWSATEFKECYGHLEDDIPYKNSVEDLDTSYYNLATANQACPVTFGTHLKAYGIA